MNIFSRQFGLGAAAVLILAATYSFLAWSAPARSASPDESANVFFAREFAERTSLSVAEPLNVLTDGSVHPRSVRVMGERLVPGGFLGWPVVLGTFGKVFTVAGMPYAAALLAALAVLAWGSLMAYFFGQRAGFLAAVLMASQPAWWFWSSRPFMPNVGFLSLLIIGLWLALGRPISGFRPDSRVAFWADASLGGLSVSLAFAIRPAEIHWLLLGGAAAVLMVWKKIDWKRFSIFTAAVSAGAMPWLAVNRFLYGNFFATGYGQDILGVPVDIAPQGGGARFLGALRPYLFPLGFAPRTALERFWEFAVIGQPIWSIAAVIALLYACGDYFLTKRNLTDPSAPPASDNHQPPRTAFFSVCFVFAVWLILSYGSYAVQDLPVDGAVTLGLSYYRYWLPIFVASTALIAWSLDRATARLKVFWRGVISVASVVFLAGSAFVQVYFVSDEGLLALRSTLIRQDAEVRAVLAATESDAVIVCDQADKLFFPDRRVITPLRSEATYAALGRLAGRVPIYYYGLTLPPQDVEYLREIRLRPFGLGAETVRHFMLETLYRLPVVGDQTGI